MLQSILPINQTLKSNSYRYSRISNSIINSFIKNRNLIALKILFYLSSLEYHNKEDELQTVNIDISSLTKFCNINSQTLGINIKSMQKTVLSLPKRNGEERNISLILYCSYIGGTTIQIKLFTKVLELVLDVTRNFTLIDIKNFMFLHSKHSIVMFRLLVDIDDSRANALKRKQYSLAELNELFCTNYNRIKDLERRILLPVQEELNNRSRFTFIYSFTFQSRKGKGRPSISSVVIDLKFN
jgi:plasmid replication initiation protein